MSEERLNRLIEDFNYRNLNLFFRGRCENYAETPEDLSQYDDERFSGFNKLGEIRFDGSDKLLVTASRVSGDLSERSGKKAQYEKAKKILKELAIYDVGFFIFHDNAGSFRFSLVYGQAEGIRKSWSNFRRFTYFVSRDQTNNTFLDRVGRCAFSSLEAIRDAFSVEKVTKAFYKEIADWYFWAVKNVTFPEDAEKETTGRKIAVIRMITRLIFIWFMKERRLVSLNLFNKEKISTLLKSLQPNKTTYYKAILQNLFFATLNTKIEDRKFRFEQSYQGKNKDYMNHNIYRYENYFKNQEDMLVLFKDIPFLNGGLFDCLDQRVSENGQNIEARVDGFTDKEVGLSVPNLLFFSDEVYANLNEDYGTKNKKYKVQGLLNILSAYNFTIDENDPNDQEVALDPELLGKVFENLLASFNPETATTARKATGSYYTPREIVDYMVTQSLKQYYKTHLHDIVDIENKLEKLFSTATEEQQNPFGETDTRRIVELTDNLRIVDPAVGSGAFPMGILHKLVFILDKLDPHNERWKNRQLAKAADIPDSTIREKAIADIEESFERNELDYGRKLYLIENCIYGVDIQPIAVQIAKLRFFISLVVDQKIDDTRENRGIMPLPNLETKFVAANSLIGVDRPAVCDGYSFQIAMRTPQVVQKEAELADVRKRHFSARTTQTKTKYREKDALLRAEIGELLRKDKWPSTTTEKLISWNPYDQNAFADFFDPEWMFGIINGFDIVLANPPYVRQEQIKEIKPDLQKQGYECYTGVADLYVYFYERGFQLLREGGVLTYISSNKYLRSGYGGKLRQFLGSKSTVHQLIDFGDAPVFEAIAYPSIIVLSKRPPAANQTRALNWEPGPLIEEFDSVFRANSFLIAQKELTAEGWRLESPAVLRLLKKLRRAGKPLGEYVNGQFYSGIKTGMNNAFVINKHERDRLIEEHPSSAEVLKPFLRGRDVKRWRVDFADQYLIKIESSQNKRHPWSDKLQKNAEAIFAETYPAIHARFEGFRNKLMKRDDQGTYFWELRACAYWQEFEQPKIIYPDIAHGPEFAFDDKDYYLTNTLYLLPTEQLWLLGLLNSKVIFWFYTKTSTQIRGGFVRFIAQYVSQIPILTNTNPKPIETLVDQILAAKRADPAADVSALEREIDRLVYDLYGLTEQEIEIVEGSSAKDGGG